MQESGISKAHKESGLDLSCRQVGSTEQGLIIEILVAGVLSLGNTEHEQARVLNDFVRQCLTELTPAGLLFDMRDFRYRHGDSIGAVFFQVKADKSGLIPVSIVAKGRTRRGLTSLLDFAGGVNNLAYFVTDERVDALEFLRAEERRASGYPVAPTLVSEES